MTIQETVAQLEKYLKVTIGSSTSITTWESTPIVCVTYDDGKMITFDLEDRDDFDLSSLPADQIINLCYHHQPIISGQRNRRNELLYWLEEWADEELEITNSELLDHVWLKQNMARLSREANDKLKHVNGLRHNFVLYEGIINE